MKPGDTVMTAAGPAKLVKVEIVYVVESEGPMGNITSCLPIDRVWECSAGQCN